MVFKKIRSFQLSDFSSLNSRRESNANSAINDENENVEETVDVITDNLGYIGRYFAHFGIDSLYENSVISMSKYMSNCHDLIHTLADSSEAYDTQRFHSNTTFDFIVHFLMRKHTNVI